MSYKLHIRYLNSANQINLMNRTIFVGILLLVAIVFVSGCTTSEDNNTAVNSQNASMPSKESINMELLAKATHASVMTATKNWDSDADDDGIVVYPSLKDASDETVEFEDIELAVDVEIWTTKFEEFKTVSDRKVYTGSGKINSWKDGNFMFNGGIKVPFEDIKSVESDNEFGMILVKVHMPDEKVLEAKSDIGVRVRL